MDRIYVIFELLAIGKIMNKNLQFPSQVLQ